MPVLAEDRSPASRRSCAPARHSPRFGGDEFALLLPGLVGRRRPRHGRAGPHGRSAATPGRRARRSAVSAGVSVSRAGLRLDRAARARRRSPASARTARAAIASRCGTRPYPTASRLSTTATSAPRRRARWRAPWPPPSTPRTPTPAATPSASPSSPAELAREVGLHPAPVEQLHGRLLHDVGKIGVPDRVLLQAPPADRRRTGPLA